MKTLLCFVFLFMFLKICNSYTNFTSIETCALYRDYSSIYGSYDEMGVSSPTNFPGARFLVTGTYSKKTNILWIFGGLGYGESGCKK